MISTLDLAKALLMASSLLPETFSFRKAAQLGTELCGGD